MSFGAKSPRLPQTSQQDAQQAASYKEADPVPLGYGRDIFGPHWLCQPFNRTTAPAGQSAPEWQYCSIGAAYRAGRIDFVGKVLQDGKEIANLDYTFTALEEYHDFTINPSLASGQAWTLRLYRGSETQPVDATLVAGTGQDHPAYPGIAWGLWQNIDQGQGNTSLPALALELGMHTPAVGAYPENDAHPYGVNPFAAIHALCLEQKGGLDADSDLLDPAHWGAQALALEATGVGARSGDLVKCHPVFSSVKDAAAALSEILAYVDGYIYADNGQLKVGWFPNAAPAGALPEITEHDLEEKPSGAVFPDWNRAATSVVVIYKDFNRNYAEAPALYQIPVNRETGVLSQPDRADRPYLHDADQAATVAAEQAAVAVNDAEVSLTVLKSRAVQVDGVTPLMPGDLLNWDYAPHSLDLVCRVISRRIRSGAASDLLTVQRERGAFPTPYVAPVDPRVLPTPFDPGIINTADVRLWFLPTALAESLDAAEPRQVTALINRASRNITGALLSMSPSGAAPWAQILDERFFVAKCLTANAGGAAVLAGDATVRVTSTSVDFARMAAQSAVSQTDDSLLLLLDDELVSVGAITVVAANTYDLAILRGRQGSTAAGHGNGASCWLFIRAELTAAPHNEFYNVRTGGNVYDATIATKHFKLALVAGDNVGLAKPDDPGMSLQLPDLSADDSVGYTVVISNEAHSVACAADGTPNVGQLGAGGLAKSQIKVYRGTTALTAVAAGGNSDQFSATITNNTNCTSTKEADDTVRCDSMSADTATIEITILVAGALSFKKLFSLSKAKAGTNGTNGINGTNGTNGAPGPGLVYVGAYAAGTTYYCTANRVDVVSQIVGGTTYYYRATNAAKSGLNTWGAPGGGDWSAADATFKFVATDFLLVNDQTILKTLVMGDGATQNAGIIRSAGATAYGVGTGYWFNPRNSSNVPEFFVGSASKYLKFDGAALTFAGDSFQVPSATANFIVDIDSTYIGPNPPARVRLGSAWQVAATTSTEATIDHFGGGLRFPARGGTGDKGFLIIAGGTNWITSAAYINQRTGAAYFYGLLLDGDLTMNAATRIQFPQGSVNTYIYESWGVAIHAEVTRPASVRGGSLCLNGCSFGGTNYGTGRLYVTDTVYLYENAGALYLHDTNGDRALT